MERISEKYDQNIQALKTLNESLTELKKRDNNDHYYRIIRDSVIKRFEFCMDSFWKFLKLYEEKTHGLPAISSPRGVLKAALDINLIDQKEYILLIEMVESRNLTSHTYHEELAEKISRAIPNYYQLMVTIVDRLQSR